MLASIFILHKKQRQRTTRELAMRNMSMSMPMSVHLPAILVASCMHLTHAFSGLSPIPPPEPNRYPVGYDPDNRSRPWSPESSQSPFSHSFPPEEILRERPKYPPVERTLGKRDMPRRVNSSWQPPEGYNPRLRENTATVGGEPWPVSHNPATKAGVRWQPPEGYNPRRPVTLRRTVDGVDAHGEGGADVADTQCAVTGCNSTVEDGRVYLCTGVWMGREILQRRCMRLDP